MRCAYRCVHMCVGGVQLEDAAKLIPEDARGVYNITSSEELDAFLKLYPSKVVRAAFFTGTLEGHARSSGRAGCLYSAK